MQILFLVVILMIVTVGGCTTVQTIQKGDYPNTYYIAYNTSILEIIKTNRIEYCITDNTGADFRCWDVIIEKR